MPKQPFEEIVLEAIDEGLSSLGESSKQAIYFYLDKNFNIKKEEIPSKIEAFKHAIGNIFGVGANYLHTLIIQRLHAKAEQDIKWQASNNLSLEEYVATLKKSLQDNKEESNVQLEVAQCEEPAIEK
ncbi:MAG: hypothetical protein QHH24_02165 [Candidatus Bathyarchaeota archaeon]|nr:hypothetical protein [Candidatus Bathyarchaeota archaeon]